MSTKPKKEKDPKISLNKLGEFLVTPSPVRRRSIIRDQKYGKPPVAPRYRQAFDPIEEFLKGNAEDSDILTTAAGELRALPTKSDWSTDDNKNTANALEAFLKVADKLPIGSVTFTRAPKKNPKLPIAGVAISVQPDFFIHFRKKNADCVGALKLHFIKDDDLGLQKKGSEYVSTLLYQWLLQFGPKNQKPMHTHCFSIDVFRQIVVSAPGSFTRRMDDVTAACEEIFARWKNL